MQRKCKRQCRAGTVLAAFLLAVFGLSLTASAATEGDVNGDGVFNSADVQTLSTWLLTGKGSPDRQAADLSADGRLDAVDLSLLKQLYLETDPEPVYIHLRDTGITHEGGNITVSGKTVEIGTSGVYYLDGKLNGGQVLVNIPDEKADAGTVKLYLSGVQIVNPDAPCIMVENAEKTTIHVEPNQINTLSDGKEAPAEEVEPAFAVIHAKDDLTLKGEGELTVTAGIAYGIHCNNDLKINGPKLSLTTENGDAVRGKTSLSVKDGEIVIDTEGDGLKSTKGNLEISGGTVRIKSGKDAIQAETDMALTGGTVQACGDHGLKAGGTVQLDGASVLATATDEPCDTLELNQQTVQFSFVKEWAKNNPITLTLSGKTVFDRNTLKKYRYAIVSDPAINSSGCKLYAGGIEVVSGSRTTFTPNDSYTDVNNAESPDLLYKSLFDKSVIHKIDVRMDKSVWQEFLGKADEEVYYPCDLIIDGETYPNCAIRTKGNSSRMFIKNSHSEKYSWRIKMDKYDKYQNYRGLTEFCMNNFYSDPSCMRDMLCYDALHEVDGIGPICSYTDMYLNGELFSFYLLAEQPGDTLAERLAVDDNAVLYKATERAGNAGGGMWGMGGGSYCSFKENMELDLFDVKFGTDDQYVNIAKIKEAINRLDSNNYKFIEEILDVPSFLKGFAVNSVMCNYDSYNGSLAHNYYLMFTGGKAYFIGWDYNLSLGVFMNGVDSVNSDVTTSLYGVELSDRPLAKLVQVPEYYEMYIRYVREITGLFSNPEQYVKNIADQISAHVQADPRNLSSFQDFQINTTRSANGLQTGSQGGQNPWGGFGWGGGGGNMFGSGNVSVVDFLIKRNEVIRGKIG